MTGQGSGGVWGAPARPLPCCEWGHCEPCAVHLLQLQHPDAVAQQQAVSSHALLHTHLCSATCLGFLLGNHLQVRVVCPSLRSDEVLTLSCPPSPCCCMQASAAHWLTEARGPSGRRMAPTRRQTSTLIGRALPRRPLRLRLICTVQCAQRGMA